MMNEPATRRLKTAIVGCGKVGTTHALAYQALASSEFVGVCDVALDRAQEFAQRFQVHAYADLAEMLRQEKVDVLSVCTQHTQHVSAVEIAAAGGVNVIAEKPLAVDLPSCDRALEVARAAGIKLGVISQRRWYEPVQRMKEAIDSGKIGRPANRRFHTAPGQHKSRSDATIGQPGRANAAETRRFWIL